MVLPIRVTRRLLAAVFDGTLNRMHFHTVGSFGLAVPTSAPGVEPDLLNPIKTWTSKEDYEATAKKLVDMFRANFVKFEPHVDTDVKNAALDAIGGVAARRYTMLLSCSAEANTNPHRSEPIYPITHTDGHDAPWLVGEVCPGYGATNWMRGRIAARKNAIGPLVVECWRLSTARLNEKQIIAPDTQSTPTRLRSQRVLRSYAAIRCPM